MPPPPRGPFGPGPGGPGGPLGPLFAVLGTALCCMWCFAPPPPPPGQTVVVIDGNNGTSTINPVAGNATVKPSYREIKALEFREGDSPVRYYLTIPNDIQYNQPIQVDLGGRVMTVKIPDFIHRGEKIIVVAPAPVN